MSKANARQVGGNHYQNGGEQHWDRQYRLFGPGYFVGCITKYVERYQQKNGVEDLRKAEHFIQKLIELEEAAQPAIPVFLNKTPYTFNTDEDPHHYPYTDDDC